MNQYKDSCLLEDLGFQEEKDLFIIYFNKFGQIKMRLFMVLGNNGSSVGGYCLQMSSDKKSELNER